MKKSPIIPAFMNGLAAPAVRALVGKNITTLKKLSAYSRAEIQGLHGIGKTAIPVLEKALKAAGLDFRSLRPGTPETVTEYIASFPAPVRKRLNQIRKEVLAAGKEIEERIGYGMPYYRLNGMLLYFAAHTAHIGLYPMPSAINRFKTELKKFKTAAGSIQFPNDQPLPMPLIREIIQFRIGENLLKKSAKK
ncbi:MAG: DUF1801 domain-containing protein [Bacteroidota bacterium]